MIEVEMPDGTILEFPDGTSPEVMQQQARQFTQGQTSQQAIPSPEGAPQGRTFAQTLFENVIGSGDVDTPGERFGQTVQDVARAGAAGVARGATGLMDLPGQIFESGGRLAATGLERAAGAVGIEAPEVFDAARREFETSPFRGGVARELASQVTGGATEFQGETTAGEFAGTVGEFLPATMGLGVGGMLRFGVLPGLASEAAGQATEGTALEPYARGAAAIGAPFALAGLERVARRAITPLPGADPERLNLAKVLDDFDIPITAGQRTGREGLRRIEGRTGRGQQIVGDQMEAFTAAALKTAGTNARRATPEVLNDTARRIGSVFDDVVKGVDVVPDAKSLTAMSRAMQTFRNLTTKSNRPPVIQKVNENLVSSFRTGNPITANQLKTWRSDLSKLTRSSDAAVRDASQEALGVIDGIMANALIGAGRTGDVARLNEARQQYRNFLAIQRAAGAAGEGARAGIISPSSLRGAVSAQGRASFAQGRRGELGDLARAGEGIIKPLPTSGTAENLAAMGVPTAASGSLGAAIGSAAGGPAGAALGALAGAAVPPAARGLLMTPAMQRYLANQAVGPGPRIADPNLIRSGGGLLAQ
jgi:hypothetical protein